MAYQGSAQHADGISTTLSTGRSLVLLQVLSRCLTFGLNQSLVRVASPEVFGTAAIQFDLVCSTILFLSREGIRNALIRGRTSNHTSNSIQGTQARALSLVPLQLGVIVSSIVCGVYLYASSTATTKQSRFHISLALYVSSSLIELAVEPLYLRALRSSPPRIHVRIQAEGGMAIVKAAVTVISLIVIHRSPLLGFALGQLAGAAWLAGRYLLEYGDLRSLIWISIPKTCVFSVDRVTPLISSGRTDSIRKSCHLLSQIRGRASSNTSSPRPTGLLWDESVLLGIRVDMLWLSIMVSSFTSRIGSAPYD